MSWFVYLPRRPWRRRQNPRRRGQFHRFHASTPACLRSASTLSQRRTMGQNQVILRHWKFTFPKARDWAKWASERVSAAEGASEGSNSEQANEWAVRANERTSEWPSTYLSILGWSRPQCAGWQRVSLVGVSQRFWKITGSGAGRKCCWRQLWNYMLGIMLWSRILNLLLTPSC